VDLSPFDKSLLAAVQRSVPLVREPFAQLAGGLACEESRVLERLAALREGGILREISGIFDVAVLGYAQALVGIRVPEARADAAGATAPEHPGVSHCYLRTGSYNLWLTLAVSPASRLGLERTAEVLARRFGAEAHLVLPTLKRYKLHVRFGDAPDDAPAQAPPPEPRPKPAPKLTDEQRRAVRALQIDLPATRDPFAAIAATERLDPDALLVHAADFLAVGWMRRYAAVLHHRRAGAAANVLAAWRTDAPDALARRFVAFPAVSHCILRPAGPDWPYTLYTMVHGRDEADCRRSDTDCVIGRTWCHGSNVCCAKKD
jgi:DNA-binding Lrp family transcriptional regulator